MTNEWHALLNRSITRCEDLVSHMGIDVSAVSPVVARYPMMINPYFLRLMLEEGPALQKQVVPDPAELEDHTGLEDPLAEERDSPAPLLTRRYPDRVLFLVSSRCAVHCRFCTRKRLVGHMKPVTRDDLEPGLQYISRNKDIRDILLSGGDPLLHEDDFLDWLLSRLEHIGHVEIIRIGSRVPTALPQRITESLCRMLARHHPLYLNLHVNHPAEITDEAVRALDRLAAAGLVLGSQTVLLRQVNDSAETMIKLMRKLLKNRVRPYYILQGDLTKGTDHFRTRVQTGLDIIGAMRGHISGLAVPALVIDLPGGGGKVPISPNYVIGRTTKEIIVKNFQGREYSYPEPEI